MPFIQKLLTKLSIFSLFVVPIVLVSCVEKTYDLSELTARSRNILELQSCEYIYRDVIYQGQLEKFLGLITSKEAKVLFSINLQVKAGIDLSQDLEITQIQTRSMEDGPGIRIRLPAASILSVDADENSIHQYFVYEYGLMADEKIKWLDVQDELTKSKVRAKQDAISRGILIKAWDNSTTVLRNVFHLAGFKTVLIEALPKPIPSEVAQ